jgi:UDP-4-amino-4,6-dideoxy-N-acetyl-beta-L-altrosamine transaminase
MIPYGRQDISEEDIESVIKILRSELITQGPAVEEFESVVSKYCSVDYAVATNSATSALHIACLALGVGPGDYVWTSANTFVASANCARYCGANIGLIDIDQDTGNISILDLENRLVEAKKIGKLPKVVIPVHFAGESCDMQAISLLSKEYGFSLIEDASHAIGGEYRSKKIGSSEYSDITVFSFHPVKIITTGEGGMAVTQNNKLYEQMRLLRSHGINRNLDLMENGNEGPWYYEQIELGYNYRITDIQAALGVSQMKRIDEMVKVRHRFAQTYDEAFKGLPIETLKRHPHNYSALHLYIIRSDSSVRLNLFNKLRDSGIGVNVHYIPVNNHPDFNKLGFVKGSFPHAQTYYESAITLPLHPKLRDSDQEKVISVITEFFNC